MSFDLIETVSKAITDSGANALRIFGLSVATALILLFGDRAITLVVVAMEAGLEFILSILGAI